MIDGVIVTPLKQIPDERGKVMHMLRNDDEHFDKFGEIYFSVVNPGAIKAWHMHKKMTLNYACIAGMVKLVLYDVRSNTDTLWDIQEIFIGSNNYCLVTIPPFVWNGFKGISTLPSVVANCATEPHSSDEIVRVAPNSKTSYVGDEVNNLGYKHPIPYDWSIKNG